MILSNKAIIIKNTNIIIMSSMDPPNLIGIDKYLMLLSIYSLYQFSIIDLSNFSIFEKLITLMKKLFKTHPFIKCIEGRQARVISRLIFGAVLL